MKLILALAFSLHFSGLAFAAGPSLLDKAKGKLSCFLSVLKHRKSEYSALQHQIFKEKINKTEHSETVQYMGNNGEFVFLKKQHSQSWYSEFSYGDGNGASPQGDLRWPFLIFGDQLSKVLRFNIEEIHNGYLVQAPGAKTIVNSLDRLNRVLVKNEVDTIHFRPVKSGFLNSREIMELAGADKRYFQFPYADDIPQLTAHEVIFHLSGILLPTKYLKRGELINTKVLQLAKFIGKNSSESHFSIKRLASVLINVRAKENDFGTSVPLILIADGMVRKNSLNFNKVAGNLGIENKEVNFILNSFADPLLNSTQAAIARVIANIEFHTVDIYKLFPWAKSSVEYLGTRATYLTKEREAEIARILLRFENAMSKQAADPLDNLNINNTNDYSREFYREVILRRHHFIRAAREL